MLSDENITNQIQTTGQKCILPEFLQSARVRYLTFFRQLRGRETRHFRSASGIRNGWVGIPGNRTPKRIGRMARRALSLILYPKFTAAEQKYWEETGAILPFKPSPDAMIIKPSIILTITRRIIRRWASRTWAAARAAASAGSSARRAIGLRALLQPNEWIDGIWRELLLPLRRASRRKRSATKLPAAFPFTTIRPPSGNDGGGGTSYAEGGVTYPNHPGTVDIFFRRNEYGWCDAVAPTNAGTELFQLRLWIFHNRRKRSRSVIWKRLVPNIWQPRIT